MPKEIPAPRHSLSDGTESKIWCWTNACDLDKSHTGLGDRGGNPRPFLPATAIETGLGFCHTHLIHKFPSLRHPWCFCWFSLKQWREPQRSPGSSPSSVSYSWVISVKLLHLSEAPSPHQRNGDNASTYIVELFKMSHVFWASFVPPWALVAPSLKWE